MIRQTIDTNNTITKQDSSISDHSLFNTINHHYPNNDNSSLNYRNNNISNINTSNSNNKSRLIPCKSMNDLDSVRSNYQYNQYSDLFSRNLDKNKYNGNIRDTIGSSDGKDKKYYQELERENRRLKREVDKLRIEVSLIRKSEQEQRSILKRQQSPRNHNKSPYSKYPQSPQNTEQLKKLRDLIEKSYYSLRKIQQQNYNLKQSNQNTNRLYSQLKQRDTRIQQQNKTLKKQINNIKQINNREMEVLWRRIFHMEDKIEDVNMEIQRDQHQMLQNTYKMGQRKQGREYRVRSLENSDFNSYKQIYRNNLNKSIKKQSPLIYNDINNINLSVSACNDNKYNTESKQVAKRRKHYRNNSCGKLLVYNNQYNQHNQSQSYQYKNYTKKPRYHQRAISKLKY